MAVDYAHTIANMFPAFARPVTPSFFPAVSSEVMRTQALALATLLSSEAGATVYTHLIQTGCQELLPTVSLTLGGFESLCAAAVEQNQLTLMQTLLQHRVQGELCISEALEVAVTTNNSLALKALLIANRRIGSIIDQEIEFLFDLAVHQDSRSCAEVLLTCGHEIPLRAGLAGGIFGALRAAVIKRSEECLAAIVNNCDCTAFTILEWGELLQLAMLMNVNETMMNVLQTASGMIQQRAEL